MAIRDFLPTIDTYTTYWSDNTYGTYGDSNTYTTYPGVIQTWIPYNVPEEWSPPPPEEVYIPSFEIVSGWTPPPPPPPLLVERCKYCGTKASPEEKHCCACGAPL